MCPEGLRFELEIKSEFNWKMKSHEIWRLELVSDKIEDGDRKRKIVCIHFGCPTKRKWHWLEVSMRGGLGRTLSSMAAHRGSSERKGGQEKRGGRAGGTTMGRRKGGRAAMGWMQEGDRFPAAVRSVYSWVRRKEEREKEKRVQEKKERKNGKLSKPGNFRGEK
jgi:hypothetical protein